MRVYRMKALQTWILKNLVKSIEEKPLLISNLPWKDQKRKRSNLSVATSFGPKTKQELKNFLSSASFCRKFLLQFIDLSERLVYYISKTKPARSSFHTHFNTIWLEERQAMDEALLMKLQRMEFPLICAKMTTENHSGSLHLVAHTKIPYHKNISLKVLPIFYNRVQYSVSKSHKRPKAVCILVNGFSDVRSCSVFHSCTCMVLYLMQLNLHFFQNWKVKEAGV